MSAQPQTEVLLEHLFRRQAGRMVAHLARVLGPARLDLAEEMVQEAMLRALQTWPFQGLPENPAAWLFRVAQNAALDAVRRNRTTSASDAQLDAFASAHACEPGDPRFEEQLRDDELRMIFLCCSLELPREARVALSLKTAGGFSVREIGRAFLADERTVAQRLVRAKRQIRESGIGLELPDGAGLRERLDSVLEAIYFIFNEGYGAHEGEDLIRQDLCQEALRLGRLIAGSSLAAPRVHALVATMAMQAARLAARTDASGDLILLMDQDRERWDHRLIALGFHHFNLAMEGDEVSEYHVQAAIAATHARAPGPEAVEWPLILEMYDQLLAINPSPVVALNRAVAVAKVQGAQAALVALEPLANEDKLRHYHLFLALRGHLLVEMGRPQEAAQCYRSALDCRCSEPERRFLARKLEEAASASLASNPNT